MTSNARSEPPAVPVGMRLDGDGVVVHGMMAARGLLARYHRHEVRHLDRLGALLQAGRRVVLVGNHVLDIMDPLLFVGEVYARYGVVPRTMGHRAWFSTPGLRAIVRRYRVIPARDPDGAARALHEDGLLMLFPGAVREAAMRDFRAEPYRLKWENRFGFLRLALEHDAAIVFVAAAGSEEMYYQSSRRIPPPLLRIFEDGESRYGGMLLTFGLLGPHLVPGLFPFPARLTHVVSEPLDLGDRDRALHDERAFLDLHARVWATCQALLADAVAEHATRQETAVDLGVRAGHALLRRLGL